MMEVLAPVGNIKFDIEIAIEQQLGAHPLPFPGMDKSGSAICTFHLSNVCAKGSACPFRHVKGDRSIVCKHWLRGLCKKGDDCEFLHEYDMTKMPECYFFSKFGECSNRECPFLHIDPEKKIKDCPWYDRGFCRHGPMCKNRHVRRVICQCYINGFCLQGPKCKYVHAKFDLPAPDLTAIAKKANIVCHYCGEAGHKAANCSKLPEGVTVEPRQHGQFQNQRGSINVQISGQFQHPQERGQSNTSERRPLDQVTCFKCGDKGHYANKCPKGMLAFLSTNAQHEMR